LTAQAADRAAASAADAEHASAIAEALSRLRSVPTPGGLPMRSVSASRSRPLQAPSGWASTSTAGAPLGRSSAPATAASSPGRPLSRDDSHLGRSAVEDSRAPNTPARRTAPLQTGYLGAFVAEISRQRAAAAEADEVVGLLNATDRGAPESTAHAAAADGGEHADHLSVSALRADGSSGSANHAIDASAGATSASATAVIQSSSGSDVVELARLRGELAVIRQRISAAQAEADHAR